MRLQHISGLLFRLWVPSGLSPIVLAYVNQCRLKDRKQTDFKWLQIPGCLHLRVRAGPILNLKIKLRIKSLPFTVVPFRVDTWRKAPSQPRVPEQWNSTRAPPSQNQPTETASPGENLLFLHILEGHPL